MWHIEIYISLHIINIMYQISEPCMPDSGRPSWSSAGQPRRSLGGPGTGSIYKRTDVPCRLWKMLRPRLRFFYYVSRCVRPVHLKRWKIPARCGYLNAVFSKPMHLGSCVGRVSGRMTRAATARWNQLMRPPIKSRNPACQTQADHHGARPDNPEEALEAQAQVQFIKGQTCLAGCGRC